MFIVAMCLVWTLTVSCDDDMLKWDAVPDNDILTYDVYEIIEGEEVIKARVPSPEVTLDLGCHEPADFCVRAVDISGQESPNCSLVHNWSGPDVGRMMDVSNRQCGEACFRCVAWVECPFLVPGDGVCCTDTVVVEGVDCCNQPVCLD